MSAHTCHTSDTKLRSIGKELKTHAPFTVFGALTGFALMGLIVVAGVPRVWSEQAFEVLHPMHVFFSALATTAMYRLHSPGRFWPTILVGYVGSIGIATLSDCVIPYLGESLMVLENRHMHLGFIEEWWLVNPLAVAGIAMACFWPKTKVPHGMHVLLSTWASLFHMTMAFGEQFETVALVVVPVFLFLAVWIPCCTSDIVFPLLFARDRSSVDVEGTNGHTTAQAEDGCSRT